MSVFEETAVQSMTMNATAQLVADRRAALGATARRGRLRRLLSRADGPQAVSLDLSALERVDESTSTPAVVLRRHPAATRGAGRNDKVA